MSRHAGGRQRQVDAKALWLAQPVNAGLVRISRRQALPHVGQANPATGDRRRRFLVVGIVLDADA